VGLLNTLKNYFYTSGRCEQLIRYHDRVFEFKGLGFDIPPVKISLAGVKTEEKIVESVSECARSIDDFQYRICKKLSNPAWSKYLSKKNKELYTNAMFGAEALILALRNNLEAFKNDPDGQKHNIDSIIKKINSYMELLAEESITEEQADKVQNAIHNAFSNSALSVEKTAEANQFYEKGFTPVEALLQWELVLIARHSDQVLDIRSASLAGGARVQQYPYHGGPNQRWRLIYSEAGEYRLKSVHSGKVLVCVALHTIMEP
jgi:hypothetical protein